jgi:hypothetical protein
VQGLHFLSFFIFFNFLKNEVKLARLTNPTRWLGISTFVVPSAYSTNSKGKNDFCQFSGHTYMTLVVQI